MSRAAVILRVLRRTVIGGSDERVLLARLLDEVQPTSEDITAALLEATRLSDADPAKGRVMDILALALGSRPAQDSRLGVLGQRQTR